MTAATTLAYAAPALDLLIRATLLMAAAWAAAAALRARGAPASARHMAWLLGIASLLALPLLWWLAPALRFEILPAEAPPAALAGPPSALSASESPGSASHPSEGGWFALSLLVYAIGAALLLLRMAIARLVLARVWRDARGEVDPGLSDLLSALSLEMRLHRRPELRIASGSAMPMTWGTLAPKLLLPAEARHWPGERRRLVLLHELAHVARRDSLSRSIASLACALYWFHPGAWFAARRMGIEQEHAADDRVLAAGGSASAYARNLLHLAAPPEGGIFRPAHAASMAGMYDLERRLLSIMSPVRRERPTPLFLSSSVLVAAVSTLIVATAVPVGATPAPLAPSPDRAFAAASDSIPAEPRRRTATPRPMLPAGPAGARPGPALEGRAGEAGRHGAVRGPAVSGERRPSRSAASAGETPAGSQAPRSDPAGAAGISRNPDSAMIRLRPEAFSLARASMPSGGLAARSPLRPASAGAAAFPDPTVDVPRAYSAPERSRRPPSERRTRFVLEVVRGVPIEL